MAKCVLFLMSDTGGGHRATALAVGQALSRLYGEGIRWKLVDPFVQYAPWPLNRLPQIYFSLISHRPALWRLLWWLGLQAPIWWATTRLMGRWNRQPLIRCFADHPADLVVSTHPLLNHVPRSALCQQRPGTPFVTVVTDLVTVHPVWFDREVDLIVVPSEEARQAALAARVSPSRVRLLGFPISLDFQEVDKPRPAARQELGLENLPLVLVVGGGQGAGPVATTADALAARLAGSAQLAIVCGHNQALHQQLSGRDWALPVRVLGFVTDMAHWMAAADCIVTKAGPGTISEALASGLAIGLNGFIPGQEEGNVAFVLENSVGAFSPDPGELAQIVGRWLAPHSPELADMQGRARGLARPQAALDIAEALWEILASQG